MALYYKVLLSAKTRIVEQRCAATPLPSNRTKIFKNQKKMKSIDIVFERFCVKVKLKLQKRFTK